MFTIWVYHLGLVPQPQIPHEDSICMKNPGTDFTYCPRTGRDEMRRLHGADFWVHIFPQRFVRPVWSWERVALVISVLAVRSKGEVRFNNESG